MSTDNSNTRSTNKSGTTFSFSSIRSALNGFFNQTAPAKSKAISPANSTTSRTLLPKNRFLEAAARVFETKHYASSASSEAPYGYFRERHIIGDCTRFHGGIFVSHLPGEAVVIDECHGVLLKIYDLLQSRITNCSSSPQRAEYEIFNEVVALVAEVICIDEDRSANLKLQQNLLDDEKISLDVYVTQGFGLPYHQVLLAGYLIEKLADAGKIPGIVSLDSSLSKEHPSEEVLLYTSSSGCVLRFSPTEKRISGIFH